MSDPYVDAISIARRLPRKEWLPPESAPPSGVGWLFRKRDEAVAMIVSTGPSGDAIAGRSTDHTLWLHASVSRPDRMPDYEDLTTMHHAVWGDTGWAYQCFAPRTEHVNIHARALHLWGRMDGSPALPNFGALGTI